MLFPPIGSFLEELNCVCVCVSVCVALAGDGGGREVLMYQQRDHIRTAFYPRPKNLSYVHNIILKQGSGMIIPWQAPLYMGFSRQEYRSG